MLPIRRAALQSRGASTAFPHEDQSWIGRLIGSSIVTLAMTAVILVLKIRHG